MRSIHKHLVLAIMLSLIPISGCSIFKALLGDNQTAESKKANAKLALDMRSCDNLKLGYRELHCAILLQNSNKVKEILASGANVNDDRGREGFSPLTLAVLGKCLQFDDKSDKHWVACPSDSNIVKQLIASGADVNARNKHTSFTVLRYAVRTGNADIIKLLIDAGAKVNIANDHKPNPLNGAVASGNADIVKLLLDAGADPNAVEYAFLSKKAYAFLKNYVLDGPLDGLITPLSLAIRDDNSDIVKLLLDAGADINAVTKVSVDHGYSFEVETLLSTAITYGAINSVKLLLAAGADATQIIAASRDAGYRTPLYQAVRIFGGFGFDAADNYDYSKAEPILNELFAHYNATEIEEQVALCFGNEPTHEQAKWVADHFIILKKDIDTYKRTKAYIDSIEEVSSLIDSSRNCGTNRNINTIFSECVRSIVDLHDISEQLPYIYDFCNGDKAAFYGGICQDTPKQVIEGVTNNCPWYVCGITGCDNAPSHILKNFAECIVEFQIVKDDYVTSSKYFEGRIKKILDASSEERQKIRMDDQESYSNSFNNFIYWNSPRGKCETRCNDDNKKKTAAWNTCMDYCKNMRSDTLAKPGEEKL